MLRWTPLSLALLLACADTKPGSEAGAVTDADGDGYGAAVDCDDGSAALHPGADELCDGLDNDCDGAVDEEPVDGQRAFVDGDGDGFGDPAQPTTACELGAGLADNPLDCDDADAAVSPAGQEVCDAAGRDEDCDGAVNGADDSVDPDSQRTWWPDGDGDGYGDPDAEAVLACDDPSAPGAAFVAAATDCDDTDAAVSPAAVELCDGVDNDCDGELDEDDAADAPTWYADADGDGYGDPATGAAACAAPDGAVDNDADCDDGDPARNPETPWYADADLDGYGDPAAVTQACLAPSGHVADATDCDDGDAAISPAATEVCDAADVDEDCDGVADDADDSVDPAGQQVWTVDGDADGYGAMGGATARACDDPSTSGAAWALSDTDCDDADPAVNPGAAEVCDADDTDEDCSGAADDADAGVDATTFTDWTVDADGDGYGDQTATAVSQCDDPSTAGTTYVADATDCDDTDAAVSPAATEVCDDDATDEDCDGLVDDDDGSVDATSTTDWYPDADEDGYGDAAGTPVAACADPSGASTTYVADDTDCDDTDADVNPDATEVYGDGLDQSCAGVDYPTFSCSGGYTVPGSYATIGAAAAALGDSATVQTICLSARTYSESPTLYGNLEIIGTSPFETVISGSVTVATTRDGSTLDLQGLRITRGVEVQDNAGAEHTTTFSDCIIDVTNQHGLHIERDDSGTPHVVVERCQVEGGAATAAVYLYDYGSNVTDRVQLTVRDSYIHGGTWGVRTAVTQSSSRSPDQRVTLTGNTIEGHSYGIFAIGRGGGSTIFTLRNNLITDNSRGFHWNGSGSMTNDYNLYWANSSANFSGSATGGANRVTSDPSLDSDTPPAPGAGASADGAGSTSGASSTDYWTNPRPSPPSIGAVEPF